MQPLLVNQGGAEAGLPLCSQATSIPILQDDALNALRTSLGASSGSVVVVGPGGVLAGVLNGVAVANASEQISALVQPLL